MRFLLTLVVALAGAGLPACAARIATPAGSGTTNAPAPFDHALPGDVDRLLDDAALAHALIAVRVESLRDGRLLYARNSDTRMIPASSLKIITAAVAGERLGWAHRFETRLDAVGRVQNGVLDGDLIVVGSGDPAIMADGMRAAPLFDEWAALLQQAGITRVDGRLIGDDTAFDDEPLGAGWAWDYLTAPYAAPSGALSYNENLVQVRVMPGASAGAPASVSVGPAGHGLTVDNRVTTATPDAAPSIVFDRLPGSTTLTVRGQVPADGGIHLRATTVANPTTFFVEGLRVALAARGITVTGGAWDIDDAVTAGTDEASRRAIAIHRSAPLSSLVAQMMKLSQNYYGEMLIKAIGRLDGQRGSTDSGRQVVRQALEAWDLPVDGLVMYDGSGLSRYNYATADLLVGVLRHAWQSDVMRGPFAAALPVAGHDGTLGSRMHAALRRRVQAKTGTIANVRALAGFAESSNGEKLVFAMIANHFTAPNTDVDAVMERVLERILR